MNKVVDPTSEDGEITKPAKEGKHKEEKALEPEAPKSSLFDTQKKVTASSSLFTAPTKKPDDKKVNHLFDTIK